MWDVSGNSLADTKLQVTVVDSRELLPGPVLTYHWRGHIAKLFENINFIMPTTKMWLEIINLKLQLNLPGAKELTIGSSYQIF